MRRLVHRIGLCLSSLGLLGALTGCWQVSDVQRTADHDFPDGSLLLDAGGRLYRYSTTMVPGFWYVPMQQTSSTTPFSGWSWPPSDAMPELPSWSVPIGGKHSIWAPEIQKINGAYYLYYAAVDANDGSPLGRHAIGVAISGTALGPFVHWNGCCKLVTDARGAIDPDVVFSGGRQYLLWSIDWGPGGRGSSVHRHIVAAPMNTPIQVDFSGARVVLVADQPWEHGTVEAPSMIRGGDGKWHLFYSGGNFESDYSVGWAVCGATPTDPCTKKGRVWKTGDASMVNPGGVDFIPWWTGLYLGIGHGHGAFPTRNPWMGYLLWKNP